MDRKTNESVASPSLAETPVYAGGHKNLTHVIAYYRSSSSDFITVKPSFTRLFVPYVISFVGIAFMFYFWVLANGSFWFTLFFGMGALFSGVVGILANNKFNFLIHSGVILHEKNRITHYVHVKTYELAPDTLSTSD